MVFITHSPSRECCFFEGVSMSDLFSRLIVVAVNPVSQFVADRLAERRANIRHHPIFDGEKNVRTTYEKEFSGIIEEHVPHGRVGFHRLIHGPDLGEVNDVCISQTLGVGAEVRIAHFFELAQQQSKGEKGPLVTDGSANVIYRFNEWNHCYHMALQWNGDHWFLSADAVHGGTWRPGTQFLTYTYNPLRKVRRGLHYQ